MALDTQKLKEKLDLLKNPKNRNQKGERKQWPTEKPKAGDSRKVRLIQNPYSEDPFVELWFHYGIGEGSGILCPRMNSGKTCPVCEFGYSLYQSGDKETSKQMFARQRIYAVVVDRADAEMTPRYWGFGKEVYQELIEKLLNEQYSAYLDPINGLDVEVKWEKRGDSAWLRTKLEFDRKESKLADGNKVKEIIKAIPRIEDIFKPLTNQEIHERLNAWLHVTEKDAKEVVKSNGNGSSKTAPAPADEADSVATTANIEDLDKAFEQALKG